MEINSCRLGTSHNKYNLNLLPNVYHTQTPMRRQTVGVTSPVGDHNIIYARISVFILGHVYLIKCDKMGARD